MVKVNEIMKGKKVKNLKIGIRIKGEIAAKDCIGLDMDDRENKDCEKENL